MDRWQNKVAVVTGASSGIGAAIAKDLVAAGVIVVGLARRRDRVEAMREKLDPKLQQNLHAIECDVSQLESVNTAFDWIEKKLGGIDILVNNAGCNRQGQLCQMDIQDVELVMQTNVMGVLYCTQRAFKSMKMHGVDGHVVLINSVLGHYILQAQPGSMPSSGMYSPSKYAITAINEILRQEFNALGTKIKVTSVSPGLVDTEIVPDEFKKYCKQSGSILRPEDVSQSVMFAISTPAHVQIHEIKIKPLGESF